MAGRGCGRAGQPRPPAPRRPGPHRTASPRRSGAWSPLDDPGLASVSHSPDGPGSPCIRPTSQPSGNPSLSPGGIPVGVPVHPLRRDPRPASQPGADGPPCGRHDRRRCQHHGNPKDPVGGTHKGHHCQEGVQIWPGDYARRRAGLTVLLDPSSQLTGSSRRAARGPAGAPAAAQQSREVKDRAGLSRGYRRTGC
jgi:hypothetical protein